MSDEQSMEGIAIIGMAGRFPGAANVAEFWENLCNGRESITFFDVSDDPFSGTTDAHNYVRARGILQFADYFDEGFFGMTPHEATITDPQHRLFLECAWEALENAGCIPGKFDGSIGVFAGMSMNTYLSNNLAASPSLMAQAENYQLMLGNDKDYLPTRVSYKLNLKGPSLTVQTACSTSLSAVCIACQNLLNYECDVALAGAVSVSFPQRQGYFHQAGGVASADGHCRAFDATASGTVPGEGVGIVALKRLDEALANGDRIYAVIKGFAMNNDGSSKMGFTAPSVDGQAEVIATALAMAGFTADTIGYVEAHGTGTPVGDPIEIEGLTKAFRVTTNKTGFCPIGSVKSNIGHLDAAAGMPGLIKTALCLYHKRIPPSLHFGEANPKIHFAHSPFYVNTSLKEWTAGEVPRRAGVSSFGMGGTNTHVVMEEVSRHSSASPGRDWQLLVLSAKTESALTAAAANLQRCLLERPDLSLADVSYTLQTGRQDFCWRRICICSDAASAAKDLGEGSANGRSAYVKRENPSITFMFPGQGTQRIHMAGGLYVNEPVFRETIDACADLLLPHMDVDLRTILYPAPSDAETAAFKLNQTEYAQPALFAVEYALARLWMSWGVRPSYLIGHSLGEYVAACLSGVFSLNDALRIVAKRGQMMQLLESGSMLAVRDSASNVSSCLGDGVSMASINAPALCVISGPTAKIEEAQSRLESQNVPCTRLQVSHAFHSEMMEPMLEALESLIHGLQRNAPQIPFISNVTGDWITAEEAMDPSYWARHTRQTVLFSKGVHELVQIPNNLLLEVGPGRVLAGLVRQQVAAQEQTTIVGALPHNAGEKSDEEALLGALGQLWLAGVTVDWKRFCSGQTRMVVELPSYPFERRRHCAEANARLFGGTVQPIPIDFQNDSSVQSDEMTLGTLGGSGKKHAEDDLNHVPAPEGKTRIKKLLAEMSGFSIASISDDMSFTEMGLDSLFLTQFSLSIERKFGVSIPFGQLLGKYCTVRKLTAHLEDPELDGAAKNMPDQQRKLAEPNETPFEKRNPTLCLPLTEAQREIWFASQLNHEASCAYNESCLLHFRGALREKALRLAWEWLVQRHEALRVTIQPDGNGQTIHASIRPHFHSADYTSIARDQRMEELNAFLSSEAAHPFDLSRGPLFRATLIRLDEDYHVFVLTLHHVICDGHSFSRLLGELGMLYSAGVLDQQPRLAQAMQWSEFVRLQHSQSEGEGTALSQKYWLDCFRDEAPMLALPVDRPRPVEWTFLGAREFRSLPAPLTQELRRLGAQNGCTLYQTLLAAYGLLLQRLSAQDEVVVGLPVADRGAEGGNSAVGHCVNFLPLRIKVDLRQSFLGYLNAVRQRFVDGYEHRHCTFGTLIKQLNLPRAIGRMPLASVTFNVEHWSDAPRFRDLEVGLAANRHSFTNFDLGFNVIEINGALEVDCRYNTALFNDSTIQRWLQSFHILLNSVVSNPHQLACELEMLSSEERQKILVEWNRPGNPPLTERSVHALFETQAAKTPDVAAVMYGDRSLTYRELDFQAENLARSLVSSGVRRDVIVGICLERSIEMTVAVLAVLKAGGAYVPLDPSYPQQRLELMLANARPKVLLTQSTLKLLLPASEAEVIELDSFPFSQLRPEVPREECDPEHLAYIIYTSGSTGIPKGVAMPHRPLINLVHWQCNESKLGAGDVTLQYSSLSFDVSFQEMFSTWCSGGTLVLVDDEVRRDPAALVRLLSAQRIQRLFLPFVALQQLAEASLDLGIALPCLQEVNTAGEQLQVTPQIREFFSGQTQAVLCNQYGPSESHVVTAFSLPACPKDWMGLPPIGKPVASAQVYVLDSCRQPVPVNVSGELYIGGPCLAHGYLNSPEQTAYKFVPDSLSGDSTQRLYRTGDLARWRADGNLEFLGRADDQVKIRGYRVEPGEVEAALARHPEVREIAVTVFLSKAGDKRLAAYVVHHGRELTASDLRQFLSSRLPDFMIPSAFVFLDALPLTPSGKVDRKSLPHPDLEDLPREREFVAPRNEVEESVAAIWTDVLGGKEMSVHDDFFELGGHSLLVTQVISRIRHAFQVELSMGTFFEKPTIEGLALEIERMVIEEINASSEEEVSFNVRSSPC